MNQGELGYALAQPGDQKSGQVSFGEDAEMHGARGRACVSVGAPGAKTMYCAPAAGPYSLERVSATSSTSGCSPGRGSGEGFGSPHLFGHVFVLLVV